MIKTFLLFTILFCCAVNIFSQNPNVSQILVDKAEKKDSKKKLELTDEDKSFIIKSILEQYPQIKKQTSQESAKNNLVIKLSEKNIGVKLLPKFPQVEFVLLNDDDIKNYKGQSLDYLQFQKFEADDFKVTILFSTTELYRGFFPTENGTTYEYQKFNGKWIGKKVGFYISN